MSGVVACSTFVENGDLWSAIRGLEMMSMSATELRALINHHKGSSLFASQVIAKAAQQVLAGLTVRATAN